MISRLGLFSNSSFSNDTSTKLDDHTHDVGLIIQLSLFVLLILGIRCCINRFCSDTAPLFPAPLETQNERALDELKEQNSGYALLVEPQVSLRVS